MYKTKPEFYVWKQAIRKIHGKRRKVLIKKHRRGKPTKNGYYPIVYDIRIISKKKVKSVI